MGIIREYTTREECVGLFVDECFDMTDGTLITELRGWTRHWDFVSHVDDDDEMPVSYDESERHYGETYKKTGWYNEDERLAYSPSCYTDNGVPAWNFWFEPSDSFLHRWCSEHMQDVAKCGFTIILHDGEFWGLGVDGGGYSFRDTHFTRLYEAIGIRWHE